MRRVACVVSAGAFAGALAGASGAHAQDPSPGWRLFGSNDVLVEDYQIDGDRTASPYSFDGTFVTNRLNANVDWTNGVGRSFHLRTTLLGADNDYLAEDGGRLELFTIGLEGGAAAVPYRVDAGDVMGDFSRRTLQRGVRGITVELQPQWGAAGHSIVLLSGSGEPSWSRTASDHFDDLAFSGVSYLYGSPKGRGTLVLNFVRASVEPGAAVSMPPTVEEDQTSESLGGEIRLGRGILLEAEAAHFDAASERATVEDREDESVFVQLSESAGTLAWKLRAEDNGRDFAPAGAAGVLANRRLGEGDARVLLGQNGQRGQIAAYAAAIRDQVEGSRPELETSIARLSYNGAPAARRPTLELQLSGQGSRVESSVGETDQRFADFMLGLLDRFGESWEWSYSGAYRSLDDERVDSASQTTIDHSVGLAREILLGGDDDPIAAAGALRIRVGVIHRDQNRNSDFESWSPLLDVDLDRGPHLLSLHLSFLDQDYQAPTIDDFRYVTQALVYSFERGAHLIAIEAGRELRRPDITQETDSRRVALRYRIAFDVGSGP